MVKNKEMTKTTEIVKTHGGKKGRSGRKPVDDKKIAIQVYENQSKIEKIGGIDKARKLFLDFLQEEYKKVDLDG